MTNKWLKIFFQPLPLEISVTIFYQLTLITLMFWMKKLKYEFNRQFTGVIFSSCNGNLACFFHVEAKQITMKKKHHPAK